MIETPFLSRQERFRTVGSTNDIVRDWLAAGTPEVCLAVADEQSAGRGRDGRSWTAPPGLALLVSLGFRPTWLAPDRVWRLAATVSLAMADAAEEVAFLPDRAIRLKWPNDLVIEDPSTARPEPNGAGSAGTLEVTRPRKLGGVLGETAGLGGPDPQAVVGIGVNADWPRSEFPPELAEAMTSLRDASGGRPIDLVALLDAFTSRLEVRVEALRGGRFDVADWIERQVMVGRDVRIEHRDGSAEVVRVARADAVSGALMVEDANAPGGERAVLSGDVQHARIAAGVTE
jgi:BirA family biotin operon repressor/biotin-[acetyl-CoA-carboxylase] ligase